MFTMQGIVAIVGAGVNAVKELIIPGNKARKYIRDYKKNLDKLQTEMTYLEDRMKQIARAVNEAGDHGEVIEEDVSSWQKDTNMMKIYVCLLRKSTCSRLNIKWRYRLGKQAEKKIADVKKLAESSYKFNKISHRRPPPPELEILSDENYVSVDSRTPIFEGIENALKHSGVNVIGVHGPGGVGKTTLVKKIADKMRADGDFKQVPLATVSNNLNVMEIQQKLADELNLPLDATAAGKGRAIQLWNKFKNGEKYLVILDDIWEKVDLNAIGIPIADGTTGCKVVLTSRKQDLLTSTMEVDRNFPIPELPEGEAWTLFKKKAGDSIDSQQEIAFEVCRRCKGLPVAINALGAALKGKPPHAWRNALAKLDMYMLREIEDIDQNIWPSLKVSYDMLHSTDARSCFLLCCLFPKDAKILIDDLTRHCMVRSLLVQDPRRLDDARDAVLTAVDALKSANLLSNDINEHGIKENFVRIHDVVRDVGISIGRDEKAFLVDHGALQWPRNSKNGPSTISICFKDIIKWLPDGLVYPQLHTLMLYNSKFSDVEVPDNFFDGMTQLTVLTITRMCIRRLPSSLAKLTNLRMLYLNGCELEDIAILKDLKSSLDVLSLRDSIIEVLPLDFGLFTRLQVLDLQNCKKLEVIPQGVISSLTSLEELYLPFASSRDFNFSFPEELKRSLSTGQLSTLHIRSGDLVEGLKFEKLKRFCISTGRLPSFFPYSRGTRVLYLGDVPGECSYLRNDLIPLVDKAEILHLAKFKDFKKLLHDRGVGNEFPNLRYLGVESCDEMLHPSFLFNNLTELIVENCALKYLLSPTTAKGLAHLERLRVEDCEIMEEIVGFEEQSEELTGEVKFSKLKRLELRKLPNLICFYAEKEKKRTTMESFPTRPQSLFNQQVSLPALNDLLIENVPEIKKIWDLQPQSESGKDAQPWCKLQSVTIRACNQLVYAFPSWMLPQLQNLQELKIVTCKEMEVIISNNKEAEKKDMIGFPKLQTLWVQYLPNLKRFFEETQLFFFDKVSLPALNELLLNGVPTIKKIWAAQPQSESGVDAQPWCNLRSVTVRACDQLAYAFPSLMLPQLQNLQTLEIETCGEMEVIISSNKDVKSKHIIGFPKLQTLRVQSLPNLKSFFETTQLFFFDKVSLPALYNLLIGNVPKIEKIWDVQPELESARDARPWCKLQSVTVRAFDQLAYAFPSWMLPQLENLQTLEIENCQVMEVIISSKKEARSNDIIGFPKLRTLRVQSLPNLKSFFEETQLFFFDKVSLPALYTILISNVPKIKKIWDMQPQQELGIDAQPWCKLQSVTFRACDQLENGFPSWMLPQLQNLQTFEVETCQEMKVIISTDKEAKSNDIIMFPKLQTLSVQSLPNLKSFIDETQHFFFDKVSLPALGILLIGNVPKIKKIWDVQPQLELGRDAQPLCKLRSVTIRAFDQLAYAFPSWMLPQLQNLQTLKIKTCQGMEVIISSNKEAKENDIIGFPKLQTLQVESLPNLKSFCEETKLFFFDKVFLPALDDLLLKGVPKIKKIWDVQPQSESEKFTQPWCKLRSVTVRACDQLAYLFPSWILPELQNLKTLRIETCQDMEVIIASNKEAKSNDIIVFPKLQTLWVHSLPNLKSFFEETQVFFFDKVSLPTLNILIIGHVPKVKKFWDVQPQPESGRDAQPWCKLRKVHVRACDQLIYAFPSWMLPQLKSLQKLKIVACKEMEVIISSNKEAKSNNTILFPRLQALLVESLPNLKSFFEETPLFFFDKVSLPALYRLFIGNVPNIKKIWDVQQPQSELGEDAQQWCKLRSVTIRACDQLVYVFPSWMLPQLQNLQKLKIESCKEMKVISSSSKEAESNDTILFPRLQTLQIESLPNLKSFFDETQLFLSNKDAFPVLEEIELDEHLEIFRNGTSMTSMEECGKSGKENDHDGEKG